MMVFRILLFALLSVVFALSSGAVPVVNEIMAVNRTVIADPQGEFDDWVEIYNPDASDLDLRGYFLSDDEEEPLKWMISGDEVVVVPAGGYLLLWLDGDSEAGPRHLPFRLAAEGDVLIFTAPDGVTRLEAIEVPVQQADISYGRGEGGEFRYLINATPGEVNDPLGVAVLEGVTFSREAGAFEGEIELSLATTTSGVTIRYTVDGSLPTSEDGQEFGSALTLTESSCVRAALFLGERRISPVESRVFLAVDSEIVGFDSNLPIVLVDSQGYDFSNDIDARTDYPIRGVCAGVFETASNGRAAVADVPQFIGRAGMNVRGASSKGWPKKQFKFETWDENDDDRDVSLLGMPADSDWILHAPYFDKSLMRNQFVYHWWEQLGYYSPRSRYVEVFVNPDPGEAFGMEHYRGIYLLIEKIKRSADRMDILRVDEDMVTEPEITGGYIAQATNINENWVSSQSTRYKYVEPSESDGFTEQKSWLRSYVQSAENSVFAANFDDPEDGYAKYLDVPSQVDYDIMRELSRNADGASTFYSIDRGGKLKMGPLWDYNQALGLTALTANGFGNSWETAGSNRYYMRANHWLSWWDRLDDDLIYQRAWNDRWVSLRETTLSDAQLLGHIDAVAALLDEAQVRNFEKWDILGDAVWIVNGRSRADPGDLGRDTYAKEVGYLRDWVEERVAWLDSEVPAPPDFSQNGGAVAVGFSLEMNEGSGYQAFPGVVHYSLDGSDPAADAGSVIYSSPLTLNESVRVMARTRNVSNGTWGALREATFLVGAQVVNGANLVISEIHYNPDGSDDLEFIELTNRGASNLNLTGVRLSAAVEFTFSALDLSPGESAIVVEDEEVFRARFAELDSPDYVAGIFIAGQWAGRLNNAGETIELRDAAGDVIHQVSYGQDGEWPSEADGKGFSLELRALDSDPALASGWRLSSFVNGSPGVTEGGSFLSVQAWLDLHFDAAEQMVAEIGGLAGDPDGDGVANLLEFGFGSDPRVAEIGVAMTSEIELLEVDGVTRAYQTITFPRAMNSRLQFALQESTDLETWQKCPLIRVRATVDPALQIERVTIREAQPVSEGQRFLRIWVSE